MQPIILATDGSPSADSATDAAIELALATRWPLVVLTVASPPVSVGFAPMAVVPELEKVEDEQARRALDAAAARARDAGVDVEAVLRRGTPAMEVCSLAHERGARAVVVGSHGWGPLNRMLFGSVSNAVLHHAPCPVLVVRGDVTAAVDGRVHSGAHAHAHALADPDATPC